MEHVIYLITETEFILLASAAGIESLYGFELQSEKLSRADSIFALQELTGRQYMEVTQSGFKPMEIMAEIFAVIKEASSILEVHKKSGKTCILYIGDQTVYVAKSSRRKGIFEVGTMSVEDTWGFLEEEGWIQKPLKQGLLEELL